MNSNRLCERDRRFAEETARMWEMEDEEYVRYVRPQELRMVQSIVLNKMYHIRTRNCHIIEHNKFRGKRNGR